MAIQGWMFAISGQKLTERVRIFMFKHMLKQEMGWFDQEKNNTGLVIEVWNELHPPKGPFINHVTHLSMFFDYPSTLGNALPIFLTMIYRTRF